MSSSASRTLQILDEIVRAARPVSVSEIARSLSLPPASAFRSLDALLRSGLVSRYRESSRYVAGPAAERLRRAVVARFQSREICMPYLRQMASLAGEMTSLYARVGWYALRICSVPGTGEVTSAQPPRSAAALGQCSAGRVILASLPRVESAAYRRWATKYAPQPESEDGATTAFPLQVDGAAVAAVAIDTAFAQPGDDEKRRECAEVAGNIEALVAAQPSLFLSPFAHLDPDSIRL